MNIKDFKLVAVIGGLVGLLSQPVLSNVIVRLQSAVPLPSLALRAGFFFFFLILAPLALWIASLLARVLPVIYQFAKFAAVGSLNSFVDLGVFNTEVILLGHLPGNVAFAVFKAISFLAATTNSFFWNKHWTFESKSGTQSKEVASFYAIAITGGLVNVGVATLVKAIEPAAIPPELWINIIAPIAGIFSTLFWNFAGYKFFVFKKA